MGGLHRGLKLPFPKPQTKGAEIIPPLSFGNYNSGIDYLRITHAIPFYDGCYVSTIWFPN